MPAGKPIAIVGAGPVGSIVAAHLASIGRDVVLVECDAARFKEIQQHGVAVTGKANVPLQRPAVLPAIEDLAHSHLAALFICTKAWALKKLLPKLAAAVEPTTPIISFQNGIGPEEDIAEIFPRESISRGVVNFAGGVSPGGGEVVMQWFNAPNYIAPIDGGGSARIGEIVEWMTAAGLTTRQATGPEIKKLVFYKTILNSALNALCASTGITMRQAMCMGHTRNLANLLIREGLSVASAVGYYYGENSMAACIRYLNGGGDHLPSMWTDLQRGLPTEIEYINGWIVQIGMMFKNVDVDVNVFFTSMIITQEIRSGVRQPDDIPDYLTSPYRTG
jgi:2-dehydropantoate 2-reductase